MIRFTSRLFGFEKLMFGVGTQFFASDYYEYQFRGRGSARRPYAGNY